MLYGDHGMTNEGNHGGGSQNEIKTVMFAYYKSGFEILKTENIERFREDVSYTMLKQLDIASIASHFLEQPVPFSSLGIMHPIFFNGANKEELPYMMLSNLKQIQSYIEEYCNQNPSTSWCDNEIMEFSNQINEYSTLLEKPDKDLDLLKLSFEIHRFANEKYKMFQKLWT